jgi:hypothetical protein
MIYHRQDAIQKQWRYAMFLVGRTRAGGTSDKQRLPLSVRVVTDRTDIQYLWTVGRSHLPTILALKSTKKFSFKRSFHNQFN